MIHGIEEREQLRRLHDRHKRLSLEVFDRINSNDEKKIIEERKRKLEEATRELEALIKKLHS
ncbi:hypothetical protein [Aequorivita capsosiphonis]|uniref:hypothetical protein n=1 Tax=Aequorivita capsosiphonis TaxID=487317 RepID=UPI00040F7DE5|nr:hypothetical protein [Aequorivita capsosiphonis]